ncbi:MAG: RDD family protein [Thermoanaerobaculia bacterium]
MCKAEQLLDIRSGVSLLLDTAGIGRRFLALLVDSLVTGIPSVTVILIFMGLAAFGARTRYLSPMFLAPTILAVVYQALMLTARGQTLGKMALRLKVVRPDGTDISGGQAWGREVSRAVLGLLYIVDYLPAFFTEDRRTVHDMLAGTRVVNWNA